jgi:hypothetical protein
MNRNRLATGRPLEPRNCRWTIPCQPHGGGGGGGRRSGATETAAPPVGPVAHAAVTVGAVYEGIVRCSFAAVILDH